MRQIEDLILFPGEKIVARTRLHWRRRLLPGGGALLCVAAMTATLTDPGAPLRLFFPGKEITVPTLIVLAVIETMFLLGLLWTCLRVYIQASLVRYYLTTRRIVKVSAAEFLERRTSDMMLERCGSVRVDCQGKGSRLDAGDILCVGPGSSLLLEDVSGAEGFAQRIREMMLVRAEEEHGL